MKAKGVDGLHSLWNITALQTTATLCWDLYIAIKYNVLLLCNYNTLISSMTTKDLFYMFSEILLWSRHDLFNKCGTSVECLCMMGWKKIKSNSSLMFSSTWKDDPSCSQWDIQRLKHHRPQISSLYPMTTKTPVLDSCIFTRALLLYLFYNHSPSRCSSSPFREQNKSMHLWL